MIRAKFKWSRALRYRAYSLRDASVPWMPDIISAEWCLYAGRNRSGIIAASTTVEHVIGTHERMAEDERFSDAAQKF